MALLSNLLLRRMAYVLERRMADEVFETLFTRSYGFLTLRNLVDVAFQMTPDLVEDPSEPPCARVQGCFEWVE